MNWKKLGFKSKLRKSTSQVYQIFCILSASSSFGILRVGRNAFPESNLAITNDFQLRPLTQIFSADQVSLHVIRNIKKKRLLCLG